MPVRAITLLLQIRDLVRDRLEDVLAPLDIESVKLLSNCRTCVMIIESKTSILNGVLCVPDCGDRYGAGVK